MYEFEFKTGKITINHAQCLDCTRKPCIKACSLFGSNILRLETDKPVLAPSREETKQGACIEDLSCELYCWLDGNHGLEIQLPLPGLSECRTSPST
jgi:hypothetical protein